MSDKSHDSSILAEYIRRRRNADIVESKGTEGNFRLPYSVYNCYQNFLVKNKKKRGGDVHPSSRGTNVLHEKLVRVIIVPLSLTVISKVSYRTVEFLRTNETQNTPTPTDSRNLGTNRNMSAIMNTYKKAKPESKLVTQSLEDLIDGVISTLVHRKINVHDDAKEKERKDYSRRKNVLCEGYDLASDNYSNSCKSPPNKKRRICKGAVTIIPHNSNMKPGA